MTLLHLQNLTEVEKTKTNQREKPTRQFKIELSKLLVLIENRERRTTISNARVRLNEIDRQTLINNLIEVLNLVLSLLELR